MNNQFQLIPTESADRHDTFMSLVHNSTRDRAKQKSSIQLRLFDENGCQLPGNVFICIDTDLHFGIKRCHALNTLTQKMFSFH